MAIKIRSAFPSRRYRPSNPSNPSRLFKLSTQYRRLLPQHPFLLFGLPFLSIIVGASFLLTPAAAIRYERHDRKVRQLSREEELGLGKDGRRVVGNDRLREEYYRLAARDLDSWENRRVERLPGESDGKL
jgi:cytochrome c oxidase assembly protein subunit 16